MPINWDRRFLELAKHISTWSKDPSSQIGAVIVNSNRIAVGMGYNGFPRGVHDSEERYQDRETKYKFVVHAEVNAILAAGSLTRGATMYVYPSFSLPPICSECAKHAIQAGIIEVVGYLPVADNLRIARWAESIALSRVMFDEAGVRYRAI